MTRTHLISAMTVGVTALVLASCGGSSSNGSSSSGGTNAASAGATVSTAKTSLGPVIVDSSGRTLYLFAKDTTPKSTCSGSCAVNWPPVTATSAITSGGGVKGSTVTLVKRSDGKRQVVIDGHPLYRFAGDQSAGQVNGQGLDAFGAKWFVVSPSGKALTGSVSSSNAASNSSSSGGSSGGGYGY